MPPHPSAKLNCKSIIKTNLNLMVFIREIIDLKKTDGAFAINLNALESIGTHWIALYLNANNIV